MRIKKGSKVEVFSKEELPLCSWRCAEIICGNGHNCTVRYDGYKAGHGGTVVERVSRKAVRPFPPPLEVSENWVAGDVVEVFDNFSWKMATVSQVLGDNYFLVRLLGSSLKFEVSKLDVRVRQSWQDDKWVVIGKVSDKFEDVKCDKNRNLKCKLNLSSRVENSNTRMNVCVKEDCFPVKNRVTFEESHDVSSKNLKRGSAYCHSQAELCTRVALKFRAIEKEGRCHRVEAANLSTLPMQGDAVSFPREMLGENFINASSNNRTTGIPEVDVERRKSTFGCSFTNLESNFANGVTCSVGSCSVTGSSSYKLPHDVSTAYIRDDDGHFSDAESFFRWGYEEGNCLLTTKEELAAEIHRLELHAYRCTIEALHASGPLSWEQEEMVTNLRISLHISNDEHLMELRNLVSDTCIRIG